MFLDNYYCLVFTALYYSRHDLFSIKIQSTVKYTSKQRDQQSAVH